MSGPPVQLAGATPRPPGGPVRVNLLPPELGRRQRERRVRAGLAAAVLAALGLVAGAYLLAAGQAREAEEDLATAAAEHQRLQAEAGRYAHVAPVHAAVELAERRQAQAVGQEVRWSAYLADLAAGLPDQVWLTALTGALVDEQAGAPGTPSAAGVTPTAASSSAGSRRGGIGEVRVTGRALSHDDVALWLEAAAGQKGNTAPSLSSSTRTPGRSGQAVVDFTGTVSLSSEALSRRHAGGAPR